MSLVHSVVLGPAVHTLFYVRSLTTQAKSTWGLFAPSHPSPHNFTRRRSRRTKKMMEAKVGDYDFVGGKERDIVVFCNPRKKKGAKRTPSHASQFLYVANCGHSFSNITRALLNEVFGAFGQLGSLHVYFHEPDCIESGSIFLCERHSFIVFAGIVILVLCWGELKRSLLRSCACRCIKCQCSSKCTEWLLC